MIGFAAVPMELEMESRTGPAHGRRSSKCLTRRNGYRGRDGEARAGTAEPRITGILRE
jgi:transposase-like protein